MSPTRPKSSKDIDQDSVAALEAIIRVIEGIDDTTKRYQSYPKCRSVEVINNPARPGSNHREVNCINYK